MAIMAEVRPIFRKVTIKQTDGSIISANYIANSRYCFYTTTDGRILLRDDNGNLCYAKQTGHRLVNTGIIVHDEHQQDERERQTRQNAINIRNISSLFCKGDTLNESKTLWEHDETRSSDGLGHYGQSYGGVIPSVGSSVIPFVMVEFADVSFQSYSSIEKYERYFNEEDYENDEGNIGSVSSYFNTQSRGLIHLKFKCLGKVRVSKDRAFYGRNSIQGQTDENRYIFVQEVLDSLTNRKYNLAEFLINGTIPNLCIIFAGPGEQSSYDFGYENYLWAHFSKKSFTSNNYTINSYFVGNELYETYLKPDGNVEYADSVTKNYLVPQSLKTVGIGVICHELSHALGLPDFYYTGNNQQIYNTCETMKYWSPLDYGYFFKDGYAPVGFTAYERNMLGWLKIEELKEAQSAMLQSFCKENPQEDIPEAYLIRNDINEKEYYILENRQRGTWYPKAMGHGLLITHVDYDAEAWSNNTVNNLPQHQRYSYVAADCKKGVSNLGPTDLKGDLYPGLTGKNEFTDFTTPASCVFSSNGKLGKPIFNIREDNEIVSFDFLIRNITGIFSSKYDNSENCSIYSIDGRLMKKNATTKNILIRYRNGDAHKYLIDRKVQ